MASPAINTLGTLCLTTPQLSLVAGVSNVSAVYDHPFWNTCQAHLLFANPAFEPVTFSFDHDGCFEKQIAEFLVPAGAPNGEAYLIWDCDGLAPTCIQAFISQGQESAGLDSLQNGNVTCTPDTWNQKAGALSGNSSVQRPEALPTAAARTQAKTDMSALVTASTSRIDSQSSSTSQSFETQLSTMATDQSGRQTENGILGFPGVSSATRMLTIPGFGSSQVQTQRMIEEFDKRQKMSLCRGRNFISELPATCPR